jgi:hypothetical protein
LERVNTQTPHDEELKSPVRAGAKVFDGHWWRVKKRRRRRRRGGGP